MRLKSLAGLTAFVIAAASCTETTDSIGSSISEYVDGVNTVASTFDVESNSILADSVLSSNGLGFLGRVRDPETGAYVTGNFMAQFYSLENFSFPSESNMAYVDEDGNTHTGVISADSCEIRLFYSSHYGDSTSVMKLTAYEMNEPMNENRNYYSNFDPMAEGYIRQNGIHKDKVYSLTDFNVPESTRDTSTYEPYITIKLNNPYTDKNGKTYSNYGTYILQKYYDDASNFKNAYTFRNNVVPGFYFKHQSGLGSMAYIDASQLNVYYKYRERVAYTATDGSTQYRDSIINGITVFWGTDEVLQTTNFQTDKNALKQLAEDNTCTYLKTPAGIFTELTLPVDDIVSAHSDYNIASARISLQRVNNTTSSEYAFDLPKNVLIIPRDSLYSFFENREMYNNRTSFITALSTSSNSYTFSNISNMIGEMAAIPENERSANWNKVVIVPVTIVQSTTTSSSNTDYNYYYYYYYGYSSSSTTSTIQKISNDMSLTSTKLVKGTSTDSPIKIDIIYSKFK